MFSVASPSKVWPAIKEDEEEVETTMLLEKMKEVVEGMQRRRSLQPEAISKMELCDEDMALQEETPEDDEATVNDQCPSQTDSGPVAQSFPATPHMSDLRHVFSEKRAAGMPTPYAGVRELFNKAEQARNPETPRLDGVREMFFRARQQEPSTPIFEGVEEMLVTPPDSQEPPGQSDEVAAESAPEVAAPPAPTRLPKRSSGAPAADRMRSGRETPTDAAQLADSELTPDAPPAKPSKHSANAPKASIVRRTTRRAEVEVREVIVFDCKL